MIQGAELKGLYVHMLWSTGWEVGKIKSFKAQKTQNYLICWDDGNRGSLLSLDAYFDEFGGQTPSVGDWQYLRLDE